MNTIKDPKEELLERYSSVEEELGRGAFGIVYKVKRKNQTVAAVKVITPSVEFDINEALHEAFQTVKVSHENIICVHTAFISNNQCLCIEMDCLEFGNLYHHFIALNNIPTEKMILKIIEQMGNALKHLEKFGIIHKDIKPANILIKSINDKEGNIHICLTDFGFAKNHSNGSEISKVSGTYKYLAPEIIDYEVLNIKQPYSIQSDIFALGVTLYYLMTHDVTTLCNAMCKHPNILKNLFLKHQRMKYSSNLIDFVLQMMSWQPNSRPSIDQLIGFQQKPVELPQFHFCLATFYGSPSHANITRSLNVYRNRDTLIGVDFIMNTDFGHKLCCWFLAEQERFKTISNSYITKKPLILLIDCSSPLYLEFCLDVSKVYFPGDKQTKTIFIVFSDGPEFDMDTIRKQLKIDVNNSKSITLIGINWCRKQYQQDYIKGVTYATLLDDNQLFEYATNTYNEKKSKDQSYIPSIAKDLLEKSYTIIELLDLLDNVDYSDLLEYIEINSKNEVLIQNLQYLYFISIIEENGKIKNRLVDLKLTLIRIDDQEVSLSRINHFNGSNPLFRSCEYECLPLIKWYSIKYPQFHEEEGMNNVFPFQKVIQKQNSLIIDWILNNCNLSVNVLSSALVTLANMNGSIQLAQELIERGASIKSALKLAENERKEQAMTFIKKNLKPLETNVIENVKPSQENSQTVKSNNCLNQ